MGGVKTARSNLDAASGSKARAGRRDDEEASVPHLPKVKDFVRTLVIAHKNYLLYPVKGKVVQHSLNVSLESLREFHKESGTDLALQVTQFELTYQGEVTYHDEARGKSLAYGLFKDSIRELRFLSGVTLEELSGLLSTFKESMKSGENEEDFSTLFWEKDCTKIQIEVVGNFADEESSVIVPIPRNLSEGFDIKRFGIDGLEEKRIEELIANRRSKESIGDNTFEITPEEMEKIKLLTAEEKLYFPLYDFVDILLEVMAQEQDAKGFQWAMKLIRTVVFALIEDLDFQHACGLLTRLLREKQQGLTDVHRHCLREMVKTLSDKATMDVFTNFLGESPTLPNDHDIFRLMKLFDPEAVPRFCELLTLDGHRPAVADVLVHLGKGYGELFSRYLLDPDPQIVRTMIQILLKTDKEHAVERIALALQHDDENTRLLAAKSMIEQREIKAGPHFVQLLNGKSRQLLLLAIRYFSNTPCPDAYEEILGIVKTKRFHDLDTSHQDQCFRALMRADQQKSTQFITQSILRYRFCLTKRSMKRKAAALRALALQPDERALAILRRFAAEKRGGLRLVAQQVLGMMEQGARNTIGEVQSV